VEWDSKSAKHNGFSAEAKHINNRLRVMQKHLLKAYATLARAHEVFDVNQLYDQYAGKTIDIRTLLGVFDHHIAQIRKLVGKDYSVATYHKFILIKGHVQAFLKVHFRLPDYPLSQLNLGFLHYFDHYLKAHERQNQNTVTRR
jgi:integrase/recombinase XerD